jgi:Cof subfamily protein (haloacid dehalogenase superfamily)
MSKVKELPIPTGVLTDVDGTILDSDRQLSTTNLQAIRAYLIERQRNSALPPLALCTARHPAALVNTVLPVFAELAPDSIHVTCNGAMLNNAQAEVIWQEAINPSITQEICQEIEHLGGSFAFGSGEVFYCGTAFLEERLQTNEPIEYLHHSVIKDQQDWITSLIVINHLNKQIETYIQGLRKTLDFHLQKIISTFNHQPYYNLTLANISKAKGLQMWAEYCQLNSKKVVMIGNGENDIAAMETGVGVAVANAKPAVKEVAQLVLEQSNDEDAVAWFLKEILEMTTKS